MRVFGFLGHTAALVLVVVGLLSGALAVLREIQLMYRPAAAEQKRLFWGFVRIAFVVAAVLLWADEHSKVTQLSSVKPGPSIQVNVPAPQVFVTPPSPNLPRPKPTPSKAGAYINMVNATSERDVAAKKTTLKFSLQNYGDLPTTAHTEFVVLVDSQPYKFPDKIPEELSYAPHQTLILSLPMTLSPEVDASVWNGTSIIIAKLDIKYNDGSAVTHYIYEGRLNAKSVQVDLLQSKWVH